MKPSAGRVQVLGVLLVMAAATACSGGEGGDADGAAGGDSSAAAKTDAEYIADIRESNDDLADATEAEIEEGALSVCSQMDEIGVDSYLNAIVFGYETDPEVLRSAALLNVQWKCPGNESAVRAWQPRE